MRKIDIANFFRFSKIHPSEKLNTAAFCQPMRAKALI